MAKLVLAIDDDSYVHHIIDNALSGFCKVLHASSGDDGLKLINQYHPDIVLLDIEMPDLNGYEVCKKIKQNKHTKDIPVMFLSCKVELEERVQGYKVGGSDFVYKPFNHEELKERIKVLYHYRQQCIKLKRDVESANTTAEIAMTENGDMGRIVRFVGQSYHCETLESLSQYLLAFFTPLNIDVVVVFWYQGRALYYCHDSGVCPLEQELLVQHKFESRFVDIGDITIVNYPKVSLLAKNMPLENSVLYGRYKDLFPHILEVTNEKVVVMEKHENTLEQAARITNTLKEVVEQLNTQNIEQNKSTKQFIEQLHSLESAVNTRKKLTLPEDLSLYINQLDQTMQQFASANSDLAYIRYQLKQITQSRNELLQVLQQRAVPKQYDKHDKNTLDDHDSTPDIELF
ncbi:response regulator [Pseudoalteromonas sp. MMG010]|uniref:response regulator n=1 Tax=Pseudoalteromonas sp. MMG010 TaxID=2822685 RepID=UPI001B3A710F|nr:response regulator [Pseudoalteromonas sp. MMG010]MBQ4832673.1 response regulator [Pseudoalteromonas sp. MMG010]